MKVILIALFLTSAAVGKPAPDMERDALRYVNPLDTELHEAELIDPFGSSENERMTRYIKSSADIEDSLDTDSENFPKRGRVLHDVDVDGDDIYYDPHALQDRGNHRSYDSAYLGNRYRGGSTFNSYPGSSTFNPYLASSTFNPYLASSTFNPYLGSLTFDRYPNRRINFSPGWGMQSNTRVPVCCRECPRGNLNCLFTCDRSCKTLEQCSRAGEGAYAAFCQSACPDVIGGLSEHLPLKACEGACAAEVQQLCAAKGCREYGCVAENCVEEAYAYCKSP